MAARILRTLEVLFWLVVSPVLLALPILTLALTDLLWLLFGRRKQPTHDLPRTTGASIVIPNWNGKDLLEKYLPSVVAAAQEHPDHEVIVVENGSSDGSAEFVRQHFPTVRLLALPKNLGFGGGCNAGVAAAKNDIVVFLNSDMRVTPGFLRPLLNGFTDGGVFAVACQIFFSDPQRRREETGLTESEWRGGNLRVRHREDHAVDRLFPCAYPGGGSSAVDKRKFFEVGGFDHVFKPFYLEDNDIGYMAWKRGWKVLYEPASHVFHEHRGTIGKNFSSRYIRRTVGKNFLVWTWKNVHDVPMLAGHFAATWAEAMISVAFGASPERASFDALLKAVTELPGVMAARWRARRLAIIDDREAFRRPYGAYFRDRFEPPATVPAKPSVLFVSPYAILPPVHGGAVFMEATLHELARLSDLHLLCMVDYPQELAAQEPLRQLCRSAEFVVRVAADHVRWAALEPHSVSHFALPEVRWLIHRMMYLQRIDVLQLEYTQLGQFAGEFKHLVCALFEHDVYFQSIRRGLLLQWNVKAFYEYLRALRYELQLLPRVDHVQVCSTANKTYLDQYAPAVADRVESGLRAGIRVADYPFHEGPRQADTLLFLGSFRHGPNQEAIQWFLREVLPLVRAQRPTAKLVIVGSAPPPRHELPNQGEGVELVGFVEDIRQPLREAAVFVCPILRGSGVRVKLLEAFAAGIPVVSTYLGAEGLAERDGDYCLLSDSPQGFADRVLDLLADPARGAELARRARGEVERHWDSVVITELLVERYRSLLARKLVVGQPGAPAGASASPPPAAAPSRTTSARS